MNDDEKNIKFAIIFICVTWAVVAICIAVKAFGYVFGWGE